MQKIEVKYGVRKELMEIFKTSYTTIQSALEYKTNSDFANKIRRAAINKGGKILKEAN